MASGRWVAGTRFSSTTLKATLSRFIKPTIDGEHHVIVRHEVTTIGNERAQLAPMAKAAQQTLGGCAQNWRIEVTDAFGRQGPGAPFASSGNASGSNSLKKQGDAPRVLV